MKNQVLQLLSVSIVILSFGCTKQAVTVDSSSSLTSQSQIESSANDAIAPIPGYKKYVIEKGMHYANGAHFPAFTGTSLSFSAIFNSTARYNFTDPATKYDQNTLMGFADNGGDHHMFSARFGWRWFNKQLQIAAYTYNNGKYTIDQIGAVSLDTAHTYSIDISDDGSQYIFKLDGVEHDMPRAATTAAAGPYYLLPYFGGDAIAPHKVVIFIALNQSAQALF